MQPSMVDLPWLPEPTDDFATLCRAIGNGAEAPGPAIQRLATSRLSARQALAIARAIDRCRKTEQSLSPLSSFRLGVLASSTYDLLLDHLPAAAARHGVAIDLVTTPYDQVMQQALDPKSLINTSRVDAVLVAIDHHWLNLDKALIDGTAAEHISACVERLRNVVDALRKNSGASCIVPTIAMPPTTLFGNFDPTVPGTVSAMITDINAAIVAMAKRSDCFLLDVAALANRIGTDRWFDPIQWASYKMPFSSECFAVYGDVLGRLLGSLRGKARKCLVLDLDNTLWGGVIGDDGLGGIIVGQGDARGEAFLAVQQRAIGLRDRGIILAVCSKNDDAVARGPFREHPEMALRESDIAVFQANWSDKASNLEAIARTLNIGIDALVFLDDNPAERAQMRAALPMVAVPELPSDPSWYSWILDAAGYFEAVGFTDEDRLRASSYAAEAQRAEIRVEARDLGDYLTSLDMVMHVSAFDRQRLKRITQLINKTNQFNLTTRRYTEEEVVLMMEDPSVFTLQVALNDRFGDLGMIGIIICRPTSAGSGLWEIDSWLMSCRVLGRQIEEAMLLALAACAKRAGIHEVFGAYLATEKNAMVADHFAKLGFRPVSTQDARQSHWVLGVEDYEAPALPITILGLEELSLQTRSRARQSDSISPH